VVIIILYLYRIIINLNNLNEDIDNILSDPLIPKLFRGRIKKECELLLRKGGNINIEKDINGGIIVELQRLEGNYTSKYSFMMPLNYPFKPPTRISINDQNHYDFCNLHTNRFRTILQYIKGIDCLSCHSHIYENNWTPGLTLYHILHLCVFQTPNIYIYIYECEI
jgi:hypothetical protein